VRRAVLIGRVIDLKTAETANFADVLDGLAAGMFLVDAESRIVHANASGHAILAAGDVLRAADRHLIAGDAQADQALRTVFASAGSGDAAIRFALAWLAFYSQSSQPDLLRNAKGPCASLNGCYIPSAFACDSNRLPRIPHCRARKVPPPPNEGRATLRVASLLYCCDGWRRTGSCTGDPRDANTSDRFITNFGCG
jgi:hypothetical protein